MTIRLLRGKLGHMDTNTMLQGVVGLGLVLLEIAGFMELTNKLGVSFGKGMALLAIGASMILFGESIARIGALDTNTMLKGVVGLGLVMLEIVGFMWLTQKLKASFKMGAGLIMIAASLVLFAEAISRLGNLDTGAMLQGVVGLGLVMLEIAAFLALTNKAKIGVFKGAGLLLIAIALQKFADAIGTIGNFSGKQIAKGIAGLGIVLLEIGVFMAIMSKTKTSGILKSVLMLGIMAISMQIFAKVLKHLEGVKLDTMTGFAVSFGASLLALTGSLAIISALPFTAILLGIVKLGLVIAGIVGLMALFGAAQQAWDVSSYIDSFGDITEAIGRAMGRFIGGLGSGITSGLNLPQMGSDLSSFMDNLKPFLEGCKGIDESVKTGVGNLAAAMVMIGGAEIVTAISSWFAGENPIAKFGDDIGLIATALNNFAMNISGFSDADSGAINNAVTTAKGLAELVKSVPWEAPEWAKAIVGGKNVETFANDAKTLATALMNYAEGISGFSTSVSENDITNSTNAAQALVALQNAIPAEGGWIQKLTGVKSLSGFAGEASGFADGMKAYATGISGFSIAVSETDITNSANAAKALVELQNSLPSQDGWIQKLLGVKSLAAFADDVPEFAKGMKAYAAEISGFSESVSDTDVTNSTNAAKALVALAGELPKEGGWLQNIIGSQNLGDFGDKCAQLGAGLASFATSIGSVETTSTGNAISALSMIQEFTNGLTKEGGVFAAIGSWFTGSQDIVAMSAKMVDFGNNFAMFTSGISNSKSAVDDFAFVKQIIDSFTAISESVKNGEIDATDIAEVGYILANTFTDSMVVTIKGATDDVGSAVGVLSETVNGQTSVWFVAGQNLSRGLANGITSMTGTVRRAAANVAKAGSDAVHTTWDEHSPSKVGEELGMYFDLGIASGLETYAEVVGDKAASMGQNAVEAAKTMLRGTDSSIFDGIDPNPTIRPIMDLTDIQNGVGSINSMFNSNRMIGEGLFRGVNVTRGINALNFDGAKITGGQSNKDIISEIRSLRSCFDDMSRAVSSMKIVLDSGELVGATSSKMDTQLGTLAMRRGRGN